MSELDELAALCARLGANPVQASTMAVQLAKRAEQLAHEREIPRAEALAYLLNLMVQGHSGAVPPEFQPPPSSGNASAGNGG